MAIQITFQLDSSRERADVVKCINALEINPYPCENKQDQAIQERQSVNTPEYIAQLQELEKKNKELQDEICRFRKQTEKDAKTIYKLEQEKEALTKEKDDKIKEAEDAMSIAKEAEEKATKYEERYKKQTAECNDMIAKLKKEQSDEVEKLNEKIQNLQKQIENYKPSVGLNMDSEQLYFNVDGNLLTQTNSDDAEYIAKRYGENLYKFQFNWKKGPVREACTKRNEKILPFCDIIEGEDIEAVGRIDPGKWGDAIMKGDDLEVFAKAEIKLLKD